MACAVTAHKREPDVLVTEGVQQVRRSGHAADRR